MDAPWTPSKESLPSRLNQADFVQNLEKIISKQEQLTITLKTTSLQHNYPTISKDEIRNHLMSTQLKTEEMNGINAKTRAST